MDIVEFAANTATVLLFGGTMTLAIRRAVQWLSDRESDMTAGPGEDKLDGLKLAISSESTTVIKIHRGADGSIDVEETTTEVLRAVDREA